MDILDVLEIGPFKHKQVLRDMTIGYLATSIGYYDQQST